jgi:hypothetical protein
MNTIVLIIAAGILFVGILLLAIPKFREALCSPEGKSINSYIAKLISSIAAVAGVIIGVNLIVEVQPIVENYTIQQSKKNVVTVRDTVVIIRRDTVFIPKEIPQNKPDSEVDEYVRKTKQELDEYVRKTKQEIKDYVSKAEQEIKDYVKQQETDMSNYWKKSQKEREEYLKNR